MARIRIALEDDDGREINGDKERLYDLSGGTKRLVDIPTVCPSDDSASSCHIKSFRRASRGGEAMARRRK